MREATPIRKRGAARMRSNINWDEFEQWDLTPYEDYVKLERFFAEAVKANAETIAEEFLALVKAAAADMGGSNGYSDGFSGNGIYTTFSPLL